MELTPSQIQAIDSGKYVHLNIAGRPCVLISDKQFADQQESKNAEPNTELETHDSWVERLKEFTNRCRPTGREVDDSRDSIYSDRL